MEAATFGDEPLFSLLVGRLETIPESDFFYKTQSEWLAVQKSVWPPIHRIPIGMIRADGAPQVIGRFPEFPGAGIFSQAEPMAEREPRNSAAEYDSVGHQISAAFHQVSLP